MTIIVRSMYNFVNCLQSNIRYEKVERPAPVGGALVIVIVVPGKKKIMYVLIVRLIPFGFNS